VATAALTGKLGHADDLSQELREVGEIITKKARLENKSLASVRSTQLAPKEFGFASNAQGRSSLRVL
jgi:hypothetical protein